MCILIDQTTKYRRLDDVKILIEKAYEIFNDEKMILFAYNLQTNIEQIELTKNIFSKEISFLIYAKLCDKTSPAYMCLHPDITKYDQQIIKDLYASLNITNNDLSFGSFDRYDEIINMAANVVADL